MCIYIYIHIYTYICWFRYKYEPEWFIQVHSQSLFQSVVECCEASAGTVIDKKWPMHSLRLWAASESS